MVTGSAVKRAVIGVCVWMEGGKGVSHVTWRNATDAVRTRACMQGGHTQGARRSLLPPATHSRHPPSIAASPRSAALATRLQFRGAVAPRARFGARNARDQPPQGRRTSPRLNRRPRARAPWMAVRLLARPPPAPPCVRCWPASAQADTAVVPALLKSPHPAGQHPIIAPKPSHGGPHHHLRQQGLAPPQKGRRRRGSERPRQRLCGEGSKITAADDYGAR